MLGLVRRGNGTGSTVSDTTHASSSGLASRRAKGLRAWKPADRALQLFDPRNKVRCNETDGVRAVVPIFSSFFALSLSDSLSFYLNELVHKHTEFRYIFYISFQLHFIFQLASINVSVRFKHSYLSAEFSSSDELLKFIAIVFAQFELPILNSLKVNFLKSKNRSFEFQRLFYF